MATPHSHHLSLKSIANRLEGTVVELISELRTEVSLIRKHPGAIGPWLETTPLIGTSLKRFLTLPLLSVASKISHPFTLPLGLKIENLSEEVVEVTLPLRWNTRGGKDGAAHPGAVATLGEFCSRLFFEYQLDLKSIVLESRDVQLRFLGKPSVNSPRLLGIFRLPEADREATLLELRRTGHVEFETETQIYDAKGLRIAEVEVTWKLTQRLALGPGGKS